MAKVQEEVQAEVDNSHLVSMWKEGDELLVHPTCVEAHVAQGWKVKG